MKDAMIFLTTFLIFCLCVFGVVKKTQENIQCAISEEVSPYKNRTIILDAGHGGEDGGAVAYDGTLEKDINLQISENIALYFDLFGINYINIRTDDISVGDTSLPTIRKRKTSDIHKRFEIVNSTENSILLSIHQNMYSIEKYSGTQVFYSPDTGESEDLAEILQNTVKVGIQPENTRKIKASDKSIYLLYNAERPSVMIECGFLSNVPELEKLKSKTYQSQLSYFITKGIIRFLSQ